MFCIGIHEQLFEHFTSKPVLWQHAFYRSFDYGFRTAGKKVLSSFCLLTTGIARISQVFFLFKLVTSELNFVRIDNNNKVSAINMWRIISFVLAFKNGSYFGTHASNGLIGTVYNIPVVL